MLVYLVRHGEAVPAQVGSGRRCHFCLCDGGDIVYNAMSRKSAL